MGLSRSATARDAISEKVTVSARSRKIWPAMPSTNTMGKNTATVVRVEATTALDTSRVPRSAASLIPSPSTRQRKMLSSTTMELSTSMPMPRASPPSDMMLSVMPPMNIGTKVATTEIGMATPMISVVRSSWRKRNSTINASRPPVIAVDCTSRIEALMNRDWSLISTGLT